MTPQQFIGLAARIAAVCLFLKALNQFASAWLLHAGPLAGEAALLMYGSAALTMAVAVLMWLFPMALAAGLLPSTKPDEHLVIHGRYLMTVVCIALGLALAVFRAMPHLTSFLTALLSLVAEGAPVTAMPIDTAYQGLLGLAECLVALVLVRRAAAFSHWAMPRVRIDDDRTV